jgi:hypothetical protein
MDIRTNETPPIIHIEIYKIQTCFCGKKVGGGEIKKHKSNMQTFLKIHLSVTSDYQKSINANNYTTIQEIYIFSENILKFLGYDFLYSVKLVFVLKPIERKFFEH